MLCGAFGLIAPWAPIQCEVLTANIAFFLKRAARRFAASTLCMTHDVPKSRAACQFRQGRKRGVAEPFSRWRSMEVRPFVGREHRADKASS